MMKNVSRLSLKVVPKRDEFIQDFSSMFGQMKCGDKLAGEFLPDVDQLLLQLTRVSHTKP